MFLSFSIDISSWTFLNSLLLYLLCLFYNLQACFSWNNMVKPFLEPKINKKKKEKKVIFVYPHDNLRSRMVMENFVLLRGWKWIWKNPIPMPPRMIPILRMTISILLWVSLTLSNLGKYLGFPILIGMVKKRDFNFI